MKFSSTYLHITGGRLRIKIPQVKNSRSFAKTVESFLYNMDGVASVQANPLTGNVLVLFDSEKLEYEDIVEALKYQGYLEPAKVQRQPVVTNGNGLGDQFLSNASTNLVADIIIQRVLEVAVKRALLAFL